MILLLHALAALAQPDPNAPPPQKPAPPPAPGEPPVIQRIDVQHLSPQSVTQMLQCTRDAYCWLPNDPTAPQAFARIPAEITPEHCLGLIGLRALLVKPSAKTRADAEKAAATFAAQMKRLDVAGGAGMLEVTLVSMAREQVAELLTRWAPDGASELTQDSTGSPEIRRNPGVRLAKGVMAEYLAGLPEHARGDVRARDCYVCPLSSSLAVEHAFRDSAARLSFHTTRGLGLDRLLLCDAFMDGGGRSTQRCLFIPEKRSILLGILQGTRKTVKAEYPIIAPFPDNISEDSRDPLTLVVLTYTTFDATIGNLPRSVADFHETATLPPLY